MQKSLRLLCPVIALAISALTGCDKLTSSMAKLRKGKAEASAEQAAVEGTYSRDQVTNVSKANFAQFISRKNALVVVDFNATWCGPCKMMGPVLDKATELHPGVVYLGKVDVDQAPELAQAQGVHGIPDVRIYKDGKEVDRMVGFPGEAMVLAKIDELSKGIIPPTANETPTASGSSPTPGATAKAEIKPFEKGWLPPGMTRKQGPGPDHPQHPQQ